MWPKKRLSLSELSILECKYINHKTIKNWIYLWQNQKFTQSVGSTIWQPRLPFKPGNKRLSLIEVVIVSATDLRQEIKQKRTDEKMKQSFCLIIGVVFLFGAAVVQGQLATLRNINCSDASSISFVIYIPDIDEWEGSTDERSWSLNDTPDEACEPTFDQSNRVVSYSNINASVCVSGGPSVTPDSSKFEYKFEISVDAIAGSTINPVTFAYDHDYVVKCFYNREQEDIMASFEPLHSLTDSGSDIADFSITLTVHLVSDDSQVTSVIDLSTEVYGKVMITDVPENLDVHLRKVVADLDNAPGGPSEYELIKDGCAVSPVVTSTTCDTDSEDRFRFDIFRYPDQNTGDYVYLRAAVIVCLSSNSASVCQTECTACSSGRKRRETLEQIQRTEFYVTAGPFEIRKPDQESEPAAGKDEGTPLPSYVIAVVAVYALLAVAIVSAVVLIVFRRSRQNVATVEVKNEDSVIA
ncbi:uncharacterized protein LOC110056218 isoform X4 [Orbicella faveolata]|uniref:uncharacterized protein LOC110056218 isoform X4 n=1 Tax=Orbicella faveolata TaxID=48498 RepID=UPI0009E2829D|nr:uncharacterized protein LOC110056218 isoform X4 [Orbicella faveolata]